MLQRRVFNINGKREPPKLGIGDRRAVRFLIEKIAPASDGLREYEARRYAIRKLQETHLFNARINQQPEQSADHGAVYRQSAFPDIQHANGIGQILL
jgi:hypothetical protein